MLVTTVCVLSDVILVFAAAFTYKFELLSSIIGNYSHMAHTASVNLLL